MNPADRERVKELLSQAAQLPPEERAAFIKQAACANAAVVAEALELLPTLDAPDFLAAPTITVPRDPLIGFAEKPGATIGRYKLLQEIGTGGFGVVYMAEQTEPVVRRVALKIIKLGMDTRQIIARFEAERQALAMMDHPNIARVLDAGATDTGRPFFVMELVKGIPITEYCDQQNMPFRDRLTLFMQVCGAVQHAHQKGIIHRDIKPSNVLITHVDDKPVPKVIDFGIAKATQQRLTEQTMFTELGQFIGTPAYMSPEQADPIGVDIDTRSDIYSLGVLLYELLTGTTPFDIKTLRAAALEEIKRIIREVEPPKPSTRISTLGEELENAARRRGLERTKLGTVLRGDLDWIIMKALEKDRTRRYESASGLAMEIGRYLNHEPVVAGPPSAAYRLRKFVRRNRATVMAVTMVATAMVVGMIGTATFALRETHQRELAQAREREAKDNAALALKREEETRKVAEFQASQLAEIDAAKMGLDLRNGVLKEVRAAMEASKRQHEEIDAAVAELDQRLSGANFTNLALDTLDANIFERALAAIEKDFTDQPVVKARLLQTVADTLRGLGLLDRATKPQEEALRLRRKTLGDDHPETLKSIDHTGMLLLAQGKPAEAEPFLRDALERRRRVLGEDHLDTVNSINDMSALYQMQGRIADALEYAREATDKLRLVLGSAHPTTLTSINNLGNMLQDQGKLTEAEPYLREALEGRRAISEDHPDTLRSTFSVGLLLRLQGRLAESEVYFREAVETSRHVLGDTHPETLTSMGLLGLVLYAEGKIEEAEAVARETLDGCRRSLGGDHPITLSAISNMAGLLQSRGKLADAEPLFREALERCSRVLGDEHFYTLTVTLNLGRLLLAQGRPADAEPSCRDATEKCRRVLGATHPNTLVALQVMGELLSAQGKYAEAEPFLREALEGRRSVLGEEQDETLRSAIDLSTALQTLGKPQEALELLREREPTARRVWTGGNALWLGNFLSALGNAELGVNDLAGAEQHLLEAFQLLDSGFGGAHRRTTQCAQRLVKLFDEWHAAEPDKGYDAKADEWRAKLQPTTTQPSPTQPASEPVATQPAGN